jgi:hypothetical protein
MTEDDTRAEHIDPALKAAPGAWSTLGRYP